jgi:hypothetical protein
MLVPPFVFSVKHRFAPVFIMSSGVNVKGNEIAIFDWDSV